MIGFLVECANRPGEIARVSQAIAERGVNITASCSLAWGERGAIGLITSDAESTREALAATGMTVHEYELVSFRLPGRPGTLAEASQRLASAGVDIEFLVPTGYAGGDVSLAAGVDNVPLARQALSQVAAAVS
ncbi:MAG TPA: ACT domain-containing protein [Candidatus Dormibacteraeota bacterium]|jgi:hypothetical protein|nr:ACT domain-containing protein [Candidatus Dormibacteraeota bacterium]